MHFIDWDRAPVVLLNSIKEYNETLARFREHGRRIPDNLKSSVHWREDMSFQTVEEANGRYVIRAAYVDGHKYVRYMLKLDNGNGGNTVHGVQARAELQNLFQKRTGKSLRVAFGAIDPEEFRGYMYSPIIFCDPKFINRNQVIRHAYKADFSSAYPAQGCKDLPDAHGAMVLEGEVEPTPEMPFAFYPATNQLAIYGELDTRRLAASEFIRGHFNDFDEWQARAQKQYGDVYMDRLHTPHRLRKLPYTVLMQRAEESLAPEFEKLYLLRQKDTGRWKDVMNKCIGAMASNKARSNEHCCQRHITSVIYARHMAEMIDRLDAIKTGGGLVISCATDSIIWCCSRTLPIWDAGDKRLGAFVLEERDAELAILSVGVYAIQSKGGKITVKHQGIAVGPETIQKIKKVEDIKKHLTTAPRLYYNSITGEIVEVNVNG